MAREKRTLNPVEAHRRSQKRKQQERKRAARREVLSRLPLARRDPSKLLTEITRLREAERAGRLDGPGRMRRKHLEEQFVALNKAREKASLPTLLLPDFDPDVEAAKEETAAAAEPKDIAPWERTVHGERDCADIAMPDDEPLQDGIPGLPPYLARSLDDPAGESERGQEEVPGERTSAVPLIRAEPTRTVRTSLDTQVDAFLRELDL